MLAEAGARTEEKWEGRWASAGACIGAGRGRDVESQRAKQREQARARKQINANPKTEPDAVLLS